MKKLHLIKPLEAVLIGLALLGCIIVIFIMNSRRDKSQVAVITCGEITRELPLNADGVFRFEGIDAAFEVNDGRIRLCEAACPDKLCEKTGFIGASGQSIICVPKKITVSISDESTEFDATVG